MTWHIRSNNCQIGSKSRRRIETKIKPERSLPREATWSLLVSCWYSNRCRSTLMSGSTRQEKKFRRWKNRTPRNCFRLIWLVLTDYQSCLPHKNTKANTDNNPKCKKWSHLWPSFQGTRRSAACPPAQTGPGQTSGRRTFRAAWRRSPWTNFWPPLESPARTIQQRNQIPLTLNWTRGTWQSLLTKTWENLQRSSKVRL